MSEKAKSLIVLATEYRDIANSIADQIEMAKEADDTETVQMMLDTLEGESYAVEQKAAGTALYIKRCGMLADQIGAEIKVLQARQKQIKARQDRISEYLISCMKTAGISKIECVDLSIGTAKNKPKVDVYEERLIPKEYMRLPPIPKPVPDKIAIGKALAEGVEIQGVRLIQEERITIK